MCSHVAVASSVGHRLPPLLPGGEGEPGRLAEPVGDRLGVAAEAESRGRDDVEALAEAGGAVLDREDEGLRDIVCVNVMEGFHPEVRQAELVTACQALEDLEVQVGRPG